MKRATLFGFGLFFLLWANAGFSQGEKPDRPEDLTGFYERLDSLMANYHYKPSPEEMDSVLLNKAGFKPGEVPEYSPEVIAQRLKDLGTEIPLDYNQYVQSFIRVYSVDRREQVSRMLGLQHVFFRIFEEVFAREGVPLEFKYLSVVESALNPHARSRVGATGLWQFMYYTGKTYNLEVTTHVDERSDPWKSTEAACKYFQNMYKVYGDWLLVIAAYNCGPGNVNKAIRRSGGKTNFWEIREYLPRETRGYVPAFIAATYIFNYASDHNIYPKAIDFTYHQDTVHITRQKISLQQISEITGASFFELKDLNPELRTNTVPYSGKPYVLRVPYKTAEMFTLNRDSIYGLVDAVNADSILNKYKEPIVSPITRSSYVSGEKAVSEGEKNLIYHTVRRGEVVGKIAERYGVGASSIARWNNLYRYRIKPGQKLKIYVKGDPPKQSTSTASSSTPKPAKPVLEDGVKYHKVQSGDNLWDIANKYDGVTVNKLKELNNLSSNQLKPGQMLRLE